jgi:hypothetical protein
MIFNGSDKLITLETATLDVTSMWSLYMNWLATSDNSKYPSAMRSLGGDVIDATAGTKVPAYIYLLNGWRIKPMESSHTLNVTTGILLVDGGGDPFVNTTGSYVIRINYSQPVQAITVSTGSGGGASAVDVANAVWATQISTLTAAQLITLIDTIKIIVGEVHTIQGLDSASPMTVTGSNRVAGSITQNFTGDGINTTTVTRV